MYIERAFDNMKEIHRKLRYTVISIIDTLDQKLSLSKVGIIFQHRKYTISKFFVILLKKIKIISILTFVN